jgi:hypothetical protein
MNLYLAEGGSLFESVSRNFTVWTGNPYEYYIKKSIENREEVKNIDLYLAGTEERSSLLEKTYQKEKILSSNGECFQGVNILQSFYYVNDFTKVMIKNCKSFMLDSGAFTFFSSGKTVDWTEYVRKYAKFINENKIDLFFELDIDVLIGYEKVLYYRKMLEDITGKAPIPVWHKSRGKDNFYKMCEDYNYVAIGGIVSKEITQKEYNNFTFLINVAHKNNAKIHGLGFTNLKGLTKYKFDSVDSTAWVSGNPFGAVYKFNGKTMVKYNKPTGTRLADSQKTALHNFNEWVKFQKYAEKYL